MTRTINFTDNMNSILSTTEFSGDIIHITDHFTHVTFAKFGEYTVLMSSDTWQMYIIGSYNVFDRIHEAIRSNTYKTDTYVDFDDVTEEIRYLDYNTGLFLKETKSGCTLVFNAV